jgi:hypothetical protein
MKRLIIIIMLGLTLILSACNVTFLGSNMVRGSGIPTSENRTVSGFSGIVLNGSGDAQITKGDSESLKIEAEDNILPLITSDVVGGKLVIGFKNNTSISTTLPIHFTITVKDLSSVELNGSGSAAVSGAILTSAMTLTLRGSGDVSFDSLVATSLTADGNGSGNISLKGGKVTSQTIRVFGSGNFTAPELESQSTTLSIFGSGDAQVWCTSSLDVTIAGSGNVSYFGSPTVNQKIAGSGKVSGLGNK